MMALTIVEHGYAMTSSGRGTGGRRTTTTPRATAMKNAFRALQGEEAICRLGLRRCGATSR
eukprot:7964690-Pyramimonas_sp.AAC.1